MGFVFPPLWYYATILYLQRYYLKEPRERAGLAASAIAVSNKFFLTVTFPFYQVGWLSETYLFEPCCCSSIVLQALICSVAVLISILAVFA